MKARFLAAIVKIDFATFCRAIRKDKCLLSGIGEMDTHFVTLTLKGCKHSNLNNKKDFTSQLAEYIVAAVYGGTIATNSIQKDWDIELNDGSKIQVKSHAKAATNKNQ